MFIKCRCCTLLGCQVKTVKYDISSKQIPFVMIGRDAMFLKESVIQWLKSREQKEILV